MAEEIDWDDEWAAYRREVMEPLQEARQKLLPEVRDLLSDLLTDLKEHIQVRRGVIRGARPGHRVPDLVTRALSWYAYSGGKGVFVCIMNDTPRACWGPARMALEAAQDLALLEAAGDDYDFLACKAWIAAVVDYATHWDLQANEVGRFEPGRFSNTELTPQMELEAWITAWPEGEQVMRRAYASVQEDRAKGRGHWSGLKKGRRGVINVLRNDEVWGNAVVLPSEGIYRQLSRWSHARPLIGPRFRGYGPYMAIIAASAAVNSASKVLQWILPPREEKGGNEQAGNGPPSP